MGHQGARCGRRQTLEPATASQPCTANLSSPFTRYFPLFSPGQSFWAMSCKPWGQEDSNTLCFCHSPVMPCIQSCKGCQCKPCCNRRPFWYIDILGWGCYTTPQPRRAPVLGRPSAIWAPLARAALCQPTLEKHWCGKPGVERNTSGGT